MSITASEAAQEIAKITKLDNTVYLLIAGQSNGITGGESGSQINIENPDNKIEIWNPYISTPAWEIFDLTSDPAQYGSRLGTPPTGAGKNPAMFHLAQQIVRAYGCRVRIIVNCNGGTDIDRWISASNIITPTANTGTVWAKLIEDVLDSNIPRIDSIVWMHGENHENDIRNGTYTPYSTGATGYVDDAITIFDQIFSLTNSNSGNLCDSSVKIVVGQSREFEDNGGLRRGYYLNQLWNPYLSKKSGLEDGVRYNIVTSPHKDLGSDENSATEPYGSVHYGRQALIEIGSKYWFSSIYEPSNPLYQDHIIIDSDITFTIAESGSFNNIFFGKATGKFKNLQYFLEYFNKCRLVNNAKVTVQIENGDYSGEGWEDIELNHPDINYDNFIIKGSVTGTAPTLTGNAASDLIELENYFNVRISTNGFVNKTNARIEEMLLIGSAGTTVGLLLTSNSSHNSRRIGLYGFRDGINVTFGSNATFASGNVYSIHNTRYGVSVSSGAFVNFTGATVLSLYNGTFDYLASTGGRIYSFTKAGATFSPERGTLLSSTLSVIN